MHCVRPLAWYPCQRHSRHLGNIGVEDGLQRHRSASGTSMGTERGLRSGSRALGRVLSFGGVACGGTRWMARVWAAPGGSSTDCGPGSGAHPNAGDSASSCLAWVSTTSAPKLSDRRRGWVPRAVKRVQATLIRRKG